jgi:putative MATE family efflux protein
VSEPPPSMSFWKLLREALAGKERDYTTGPVGEAVILLAIPMVAEMVMESLLALTDVYFVSRLGSSAVAAVGLTESMLTLLYGCAMGLAMATTALVARRIGEGDAEGASEAGAQALWLALGLAAVIAVPGALYAEPLLVWMGFSPAEAAAGVAYPRWMFGGCVTITLIFVLNAVFRGAGDATIAMRTLWLANGINILLDPCLIFGLGPFPELGLEGAAVATNIGRGTGVLYQLWCLTRASRGRIHLSSRRLRFQPALAGHLLRLSYGGVAQFLVATGSWMLMMRFVAGFGSAAAAGYTIAIRIVVFTILPAWGMSNAAATLVGQNLGAGRPERAEASVWQTGLYVTVFLVAIGLLFGLAAAPIAGFFTTDPVALAAAVDCLRIVALGYLVYGFGMVMVQAFNGAGDTWTPTKINLVAYWLIQLPTAWLLANPVGWGPAGVFAAIPIAEAVMTLLSLVVFRRGRWREVRV